MERDQVLLLILILYLHEKLSLFLLLYHVTCDSLLKRGLTSGNIFDGFMDLIFIHFYVLGRYALVQDNRILLVV